MIYAQRSFSERRGSAAMVVVADIAYLGEPYSMEQLECSAVIRHCAIGGEAEAKNPRKEAS